MYTYKVNPEVISRFFHFFPIRGHCPSSVCPRQLGYHWRRSYRPFFLGSVEAEKTVSTLVY